MRAVALAGMVLGAVVAGPGAEAAGLRAGGAMTGPAVSSAGDGWSLRGFDGDRAAEPELRIGFTPRGGASLLLEDVGRGGDGALGAQVGMAAGVAGLGRLGSFGLLPPSRPLPGLGDDEAAGLAVGGALLWSDFTIAGAYGRGALVGGALDLWGGAVGYGPVTARLAYGLATDTTGRSERELWMLGTDVATWSWLTLEGDLAVTTQQDREPTTVGRFGLRLNF